MQGVTSSNFEHILNDKVDIAVLLCAIAGLFMIANLSARAVSALIPASFASLHVFAHEHTLEVHLQGLSPSFAAIVPSSSSVAHRLVAAFIFGVITAFFVYYVIFKIFVCVANGLASSRGLTLPQVSMVCSFSLRILIPIGILVLVMYETYCDCDPLLIDSYSYDQLWNRFRPS
mgnify:CR=1 FL=1